MYSNLTLYSVFVYVSTFLVMLPISIGIYKRIYLCKRLRAIFFLLISYLIIETISFVYAYYNINNLFLMRICTISEMVFLSMFYYNQLRPRKWKFFIGFGFIIFWSVTIWDYWENGNKAIDDKSATAASAILIIYSMITFLYLNNRSLDRPLSATPEFWINAAVLLYFTADLFVFTSSMYMKDAPKQYLLYLWNINLGSNIIYNLLITVGLWKKYRV